MKYYLARRTDREQQTTTTPATTATTTTTTTTTTPTTLQKSSSSSTTNGRNESETMMELESLKDLFFEVFNRKMPSFIAGSIMREMIDDEEGKVYWYYRYAMMQTALAPHPSWKYTEAIVSRLYRERVNTKSLVFMS